MPIDETVVKSIFQSLGEPSFKYTGKGLIEQYKKPIVYIWVRDGKLLHFGYSGVGFISCFKPDLRFSEVQENDKLIIWPVKSRSEGYRIKLNLMKALGIE